MAAAVLSSEAPDITSSAPRRKSGRVSKKPEPFVPASSPAGSAKRKRNDTAEGGDDLEDPSDEEEGSSEGEPDEEELREQRRKKKTKAPARKPAAKKPKTNGTAQVSLAIRPAAPPRPKKPRKAPVRKSAFAENADGLYADVFAHGNRLDDVAAQWVASFRNNASQAVADIVNFVLRSAGCDIKIDENDVGDPDNAPNRLGEIQEEYQAQDVSEYPLIAKTRGGPAFKRALHDFFGALIQTVAQAGLLYENQLLIENIQVWVSTLSSASNRPFRHTSTVVSLAIISALSRVAREIVDNSAKKIRQSETESKKARVNKGRVAAVNKEVEDLAAKKEAVEASIGDWFDTVFVHRYRDIDPKIRVECVEALADWIMTYPDKFFDGEHLRYLGWVLSDTQHTVRAEVLKQLQKLFKDVDKLAGLKTFTERFRPRIVEMATRDAEPSVRAAAVDLLDTLREAGYLEPDDIDSVGKLIFDSEPKVRKAVVGFFAETVTSTYELQIDDMGGQDALDEALPSTEEDEEYEHPRLEWLKLKCLVEQLLAYDSEDAELPTPIERFAPTGAELGLFTAGFESRFSLAAQTLYDSIPEVRAWELIAGYLLYDHSQTEESGAGEDVEAMLRQNCKLEEREEIVLLDILNAAASLHLLRLAEAQNDKKKTKAQRQADKEEQAETAKRLTVLIPRLLKKFGALPEAASLCLRLERLLNLDVFQELRQNAALVALLDDINKQFLTHHNERVLQEVREALLHAQRHEELKEITNVKIQALWDDLINTFNALRQGRDFSKRGNLSANILTGVSNVVLKMSELAKLDDPSILDKIPPTKPKGKSKKAATESTPPIMSMLQLLDRGESATELDPEAEAAEDSLVRHAVSFMLPYFLWKFKYCEKFIEAGNAVPDDDLTAIAERRDLCLASLMSIMQSRKGADDLRLDAANLLLDVYNLFFALKNIKVPSDKSKKPTADNGSDDWESLCQEVDEPTTKAILQILTAAESNLSKRTKKRLEEPDVDDDPVDPDDEPESSEDEEEGDERIAQDKVFRTILAEGRLAELGGRIVHGILVGSLDGPSTNGENTVRKRLERNKAKLGPSWKEIVAHLDVQKSTAKGKKKALKPAKEAANAKSKEIVVEDDEEEAANEVPGDEIEDEEMADEQVNGAPNGDENGADEEFPDVESVLGD
ncbi:STAG domain-containing protein [Lophiotrema nucula]|uniref:STAG domain-containing protein n=1 Tax=Lophiotrema nucula TaxID=690887 RepID=A0A6A5Z1K6_9PLEO|nr:STAG domain-containing protein [Lophiotrema nucula]